MRRGAERGGAAVFAVLWLVAPVTAWSQTSGPKPRSRQEESRRKLLEEVGLQKTAPPASPAAEPSPGPAGAVEDAGGRHPAEGSEDDGGPGGPPARGAVRPPASSFRRVIHPLLLQTCKACHAPGGAAAATRLLLTGEAGADHAAVARLVNTRVPRDSLLLVKASGQKVHAGGGPWADDSAAYARVSSWIQGGAHLDAAGEAVETIAAPVAVPVAVAGEPHPARSSVARPPAAPSMPATAAESAAVGVSGDVTVAPSTAARAVDFVADVHPTMMRLCAACHARAGPAATTRLVLSGDAAQDYPVARALVDLAAPAGSALLVKGAGQGHAGGPVIPVGSAGHTLILSWVVAGAPATVAAGAPAATVTGTPASPIGPAPPLPPPASAPPPNLGPAGWRALPFGFALNGRFDIAYERRDFSGDPFQASAVNALRSYHHFLFLSRESPDDPVGLSVELLSLQFWEAHYRFTAAAHPIQVVLAAGKLLVPFGADPLMHQSYGGLAGFDQKILPVIWAQEGVAIHALWHRGALSVTDDLYVVRGYQLTAADGLLNLQNDFSSDDHTFLGFGDRLGGAWGPLSAWYSAYYNNLGFARHLFMQAADVMLWRMRWIPVLGHFSFAAGLLRADVSGGGAEGTGGPGKDYYDFGSYFQLRYHPNDWLYVQYRQGLRTFNNRRGLIIDDTRLTSDDASTHSFGVVARWGGLSGGAYYFINLEKGPELPNDFLRVSLTYDF